MKETPFVVLIEGTKQISSYEGDYSDSCKTFELAEFETEQEAQDFAFMFETYREFETTFGRSCNYKNKDIGYLFQNSYSDIIYNSVSLFKKIEKNQFKFDESLFEKLEPELYIQYQKDIEAQNKYNEKLRLRKEKAESKKTSKMKIKQQTNRIHK